MTVVIVGLIVGSFLNVVAWRSLRDMSIIFPPSHCPSCKHRLSPLDLIPVLSYLYLRGKCRYCETNISALYPLAEIITAILLYWSYKKIGLSLELVPISFLMMLLVISVLTDLRKMLILDKVTLPFTVVFLLLRTFIGEEPFFYYVLGGMIGFTLLFVLSLISKGGFGGGDVKLYLAIGVALGPRYTVLSFTFATILGAIVAVSLLIFRKIEKKQPIPFAPFILFGTVVAYFYGDDFLTWYRDFF